MAFVIALVIGGLTGYFAAVMPGPVNFGVIRKAMRNEGRAARLVAFGGASVDTLFCLAIGFGVSWFKAIMTQPYVLMALALFLCGYGIWIIVIDRRGMSAAAAASASVRDNGLPAGTEVQGTGGSSVIIGALQGAANPALLLSWTIILTFLAGHGILGTSALGTVGFAVGVGIGGFAWFCSLIWIVTHFASSPVVRWWQRSTTFGGGTLIVIGTWYAFWTLRHM